MSAHLQKMEAVSHQEASLSGFHTMEVHDHAETMSSHFTLIHSSSLHPFRAEIIGANAAQFKGFCFPALTLTGPQCSARVHSVYMNTKIPGGVLQLPTKDNRIHFKQLNSNPVMDEQTDVGVNCILIITSSTTSVFGEQDGRITVSADPGLGLTYFIG